MKNLLACGVAAMVIAACTTTEKVAAVQPMDAALSCDQLQAEFVKLDGITKTADGNKGVNTANVAAVLLFWPAAVGNYLDADSAQKLVNEPGPISWVSGTTRTAFLRLPRRAEQVNHAEAPSRTGASVSA